MRGSLFGSPLAIAALVFALSDSCALSRDIGSVRATFAQQFGGVLDIDVQVEGDQGLSLNAASVILKGPDSTASLMRYDADSCRYRASLSAPASGTYGLSVSSKALSHGFDLDVPFNCLAAKPVISTVSDSGGNSASLGDSLDAGRSIAVIAGEIDGADRYHLYIYNSGNLAYSQSSSSATMTLPAGSLEAGSYSACVEAQVVFGDPLLVDEDYYSVSSASSSLFVFTVEEP